MKNILLKNKAILFFLVLAILPITFAFQDPQYFISYMIAAGVCVAISIGIYIACKLGYGNK